jgi:hypothetical protein
VIPPGTQVCWYKGVRLIYVPGYYHSRWYHAPLKGLVPVPTLERT